MTETPSSLTLISGRLVDIVSKIGGSRRKSERERSAKRKIPNFFEFSESRDNFRLSVRVNLRSISSQILTPRLKDRKS